MINNKSKIFGIGLNKTGTSTLEECGKILGYRVKGPSYRCLEDIRIKNFFGNVIETVNKYDLFQDWPWPLIYKELDQEFPNSKFILTVRKDSQTWLNSLKAHSLRTKPLRNCRKLAYGYHYPHQYQQEHIEFYLRHQQEVRQYFQGRKQDFLEICWEEDNDWRKLCHFLGMEIPNVKFPHANKTSERKLSRKRWLMNRILSLMPIH